MYQGNPVGVELFSYINIFVAHWINVTHFVQRNLDEKRETTRSSCDLFSRKKRWFLSKRRGYTHAAKLQLSVRTKSCTNSHTKSSWTDMSVRLLNAINTDFELQNNQLQYPKESTISCLDIRKFIILCNTRTKARGWPTRWRHGGTK